MASLPRKNKEVSEIEKITSWPASKSIEISMDTKEAPAAYNITPLPQKVYEQTHEYTSFEFDSRQPVEFQNAKINVYALTGWRLIAVAGDVVRTLYFERAVKL